MINKQITLAARPVGFPKETDFKLIETPLPELKDGEFLVKSLYLSLDPYMRGRMNDAKSYAPAVQLGEVMVGGVVGKVLESKNANFQPGDIVEHSVGWQEYAVSDGKGVRKIDPALAPITTALGILGMPGMTAYFGFLDICQPKAGETVVVSGAAGAVGSLVGQIAKITGCRAVGIAGADDKIDYIVNELGFDAGFNYKTTSDYAGKIRELCPEGVDCYFDNVGGAITDGVFINLNTGARISICGQISQYNLEKPEMGPRILLPLLLVRQSKAEGFIVSRYANRFEEGMRQMAEWLKAGKLKYEETIEEGGLESAPRAFLSMLKGSNTGKQLVKIADE
jgi:NADPH-dependent curcumin reductase CurA